MPSRTYEDELSDLMKQRESKLKEANELAATYDHYQDVDSESDFDIDESSYLNSPEYLLNELHADISSLEEEIYLLSYAKQKEQYMEEYSENISRYEKGNIIPGYTRDDFFDRSSKAKSLAQDIVSRTTETPFNIGIFGRWGEGKTTFLKLLQDELVNLNGKQSKNDNYKAYIVNYDASEYEEKNKIWASILRTLFLEYETSTWFPKLFYNYNKITNSKKEFWSNLLSYAIAIVIVFISSSISVTTLLNNVKNEWSILAGSSSLVVAALILFTKVIIPALKTLLQSAIPLSDKITQNISLPKYSDKLGERETYKKDLDILAKSWINRFGRKKNRLVLFVDELDRCSEKGIFEFFQSLQLFMKAPQLVIVFAIDEERLKIAVGKYYNTTATVEVESILTDYLEKYIDIPYSLDTQIDYKSYVIHMLQQTRKGSDSFALSEEERVTLLSAVGIIPHSRLTPRKVKKIINILIVSKEFCVVVNRKREMMDTIDFRGFILWFFFFYFYKEFAEDILLLVNKSSENQTFRSMLSKEKAKRVGGLEEGITKCIGLELINDLSCRDIKSYNRFLKGIIRII